MKTVLTGASGFVGSTIAKVLTDRHGDEVVSLSLIPISEPTSPY